MKSLVRWGITLGLVGTTLMGTVFVSNIPVLALSEQEIREKLDSIPVYLITDENGLPLSRNLPDSADGQKGGSVTGVYMSRQDALKSIDDLEKAKGKDPKLDEILENLQVTVVPLGSIYQQLQETKNQPNRLLFAFKPENKEINGALELLRQSGQKVDQFKSIPVFAVRFAPDKGYVPIRVTDNKELIPLYLSEEDAQGLLNQVKPKFPQADIQVIDVDGVIQTLQGKNDDWLQHVYLVPSPESREYIQNLSQDSKHDYYRRKPINRNPVDPSHPRQSHPRQSHPQQNRPQQNRPQQSHPQQNPPQQNRPQQNHPQQNHPQQNHPQQNH